MAATAVEAAEAQAAEAQIGADVRITGLEAIPLRIPYRVPWENLHTTRAGARREWLHTIVLRLRAGGLVGLGEVQKART